MVKHISGQRKCPKNKFPDTDVKYMGSGKFIKNSENQKINLRGKYGEKNSFYGKHHFEDTKLKNRNAHLGKQMSEETKQKISKTMKLIKLKEKQNGTL